MAWEDEYPHVAAALGYAEDVVAGRIPAGIQVRQACQRQLDDLNRDAWHFYFDAEAAEAVCAFIESLPHIKGRWAGSRIRLEPWQCFGISTPFGWRYSEDRHNNDGILLARAGTRRFRTAYTEVPRKNAKTTIAAGVGLYLLAADGEGGAEVYSAATTRKQASIVFSVAQGMARRATSLDVRAHNINDIETASKFEALHAQGETLDGYNIHGAICDELHAWKKRSVYEVIQTATGAREQPMIYSITTAGDNLEGICYELRAYLQRVLAGAVIDDSFFGLIYTIDPKDDWRDMEVWKKANPNWGVSVSPLELENDFLKAREVPSQLNVFLKYHLDVWTNSAVGWMDMMRLMQCYDPSLRIEDFVGEPAWIGIDLASKRDITSLAVLFKKMVGGKEHIYCFMRHWLPEEAVKADPNGMYDGWVRMGAIQTTPGNVIDVDQIENDTQSIANLANVNEIAIDPGHNSTQYGVHMLQRGFTVIDVRPTVLNFSDPMKWLEAYVQDGRFHYCCPVLTWMVSNVEARRDLKDNVYPRKASDRRKIDGVVATLMALNRLRASAEESVSGLLVAM